MELASIAIIISAAVFLLQLVTLAQIAGVKKSLKTQGESRPQQAPSAERFDKRENENRRFEKRPYHDQRQRPQQPQQLPVAPAANDPVEKSLRDINLRLKNAERDQEFARRKLQENLGRENHPRNRDDRRGNRDRNRNNRRDNWQDRNRQSGYQAGPQANAQSRNLPGNSLQAPSPAAAAPATAATTTSDAPLFERKAEVPVEEAIIPVVQEVKVQPVPQEAPAVSTADLTPSDFSTDETFLHGRKIIVKRRPLKEGETAEGPEAILEGAKGDGETEAPIASGAPFISANPDEETTTSASPADSAVEIQFGRRKAL